MAGQYSAARLAWNLFLGDFLPAQCSVCSNTLNLEQTRGGVCNACEARLELAQVVKHRACMRCADMLPLQYSSNALPCTRCQRHPPPYSACLAPLQFSALVREMVLGLKFGGRRDMALALSYAAAKALRDELNSLSEPSDLGAACVLMPIPLSPQRLAERGFNQSLLLAKQLRKQWPSPKRPKIAARLLARHNETGSARHQHLSALNRAQRAEQIQNAFYISRPRKRLPKRVVLIDDVMTTGATMRAAAHTLLSAGVTEVIALPLARAQQTPVQW